MVGPRDGERKRGGGGERSVVTRERGAEDSRRFNDQRADGRWHVNQTTDKKKGTTWPNENSELGSGLERRD